MNPHRDNADRFVVTLQKLLDIPAGDLRTALTHACNAIAEATGADKVDAFLYDASRDSLVALGTSTQPLSALQKRLGLDVMPLSNGGRSAWVFTTGETYVVGDTQQDPDELRGVKEGLGVRAQLGVPLHVGPQRRGLIMLASLATDFFSERDVGFVRSAARWVGRVAEHAELVQSIERNAVEQGRSLRAQEIFSVLAHDLRNYVSPVTLRLYKIRNRAELEGRGSDLQDADAALSSVARLNGLLSDLLDSTRLDAGAFDITVQPVDLTSFARNAAAALSTMAHEIVVRASGPVVVTADPTRLRQCVDNVLSNAIAHSPGNAPVSVFVSEVVHDGMPWGQMEIVDEGPGIPDAALPCLFDRFYTGRGSSGGIGLGLYIAKRIAIAHGGDLIADRCPGKGARFTIRLPAMVLPDR